MMNDTSSAALQAVALLPNEHPTTAYKRNDSSTISGVAVSDVMDDTAIVADVPLDEELRLHLLAPTKSTTEHAELSSSVSVSSPLVVPPLPPYLRNNESLPGYLTQTKRLFSHARTDRSGAAMLNAFLAHAYAYHYGIPFEGICGKTAFGETHNQVIQAFGLEQVLKWQSCPQKDNQDVDTYVDRTVAGMRGANTAMLTREWMQVIRSLRKSNGNSTTTTNNYYSDTRDKQNDNSNARTTIKVAVHVRRGDITPCWVFDRYLPNQFYLDLLDQVLSSSATTNGTTTTTTTTANSSVTIYTEDESYESMQDFVDRGYRIVCGGDLKQVWAEMDTQYDVLIMSASSFSYIPAILSPNLKRVIYVPNKEWKPLQSWEVAPMKLVQEAKAWIHDKRQHGGCSKEEPRVWYNFTTRMEDNHRSKTHHGIGDTDMLR